MGAIWGPPALRLLRIAVGRTTKIVRQKIATITRPVQGEVSQLKSGNGRQPVHPAALLKQQKRARWFSGTNGQSINKFARRYFTSEFSANATKFDRSRLPTSNTGRRVGQTSGRAPFATTLRPNLTGGAMPRSAGGYGLGGGGARYFSHTPAAPAQVVQNVSQAMRAFFLSGQKLRYDGLDASGRQQYRAVSPIEDEAMRKLTSIPKSASGAFIDFHLSPTVTALSPLAMALSASNVSSYTREGENEAATLNTNGFLDILSADFGRALRDLTAIYADLRRLSALGDLPIEMAQKNILRVRFPGVDAATAEMLCEDINLQRGVIGQDADFDKTAGVPMALQFSFAPQSEKTLTSPGGSARSNGSGVLDELSSLGDDSFVQEAFFEKTSENPWLSDSEYLSTPRQESCSMDLVSELSQNFEGLEGVYRFLEECDRAKGRVS